MRGILHHPFHLFQQHCDALDVVFLTKKDSVRTNADIAACTGVHTIASLWQVHGNRIVVVREPMQRAERADGLVTDQRGLLLTIRAADCQQLLVYAPECNVVGLLHVGWRGLLENTIQSFFETLRDEWNIHPQDTLVGIGPSLRQCCAEYREPDHPLRQFPKHFWNRNNIDLAGIADMQLTELGVSQDHIERHPDCTCCHPEKYWTYRGGDREKVSQWYTNVLAVQWK